MFQTHKAEIRRVFLFQNYGAVWEILILNGRGLWVTSGDRTPWLKEGGKGTKPLIVQFQVRPDPLAK